MDNIMNHGNKESKKKENFGNIINLLNQKESIQKIEKEYLDVIEFILNLKKNELKEILIPVCDDFAYFTGKIKNPNECKIYLGEDYFLKTSSDNAIKILSNRLIKTREILNNVNKDIIKENVIEYENDKKEVNRSLKKLHDDTFEIVEEVSEKDLQNLKNTSALKQNRIDEKEREKLIEEKLQKMKNIKLEKESQITLSVVKKTRNDRSTDSHNKVENKTETNSAQNLNNLNSAQNDHEISFPVKKKEDTIDSNIKSQINSNEKYENEKEENKTQRSFFYNLYNIDVL